MPTYNYQEGWLVALRAITDDAAYTAKAAVVTANCTYIGVLKAGSGFDIQPSYTERDNVGNLLNLKFELTIDVDVLTEIGSTLRGYLDGVTLSLLYVPKAYATVDREAATIVLGAGTGVLFCPTELFVGDAYKLGQQEVTAIKITGKCERTTKAALRKTVTTSNT